MPGSRKGEEPHKRSKKPEKGKEIYLYGGYYTRFGGRKRRRRERATRPKRLWGVGTETSIHRHRLGIYILLAAAIMSFLETVFVINFCCMVCVRSEFLLRCWRGVIWFDNWKKGCLYLLMSIGCFLRPHQVWMGIISGVMMIICSLLYFTKTYRGRQEEIIAEERAKNQTYDRFEVPDDIDDSIIDTGNPILTFREETVAEQEEILDV